MVVLSLAEYAALTSDIEMKLDEADKMGGKYRGTLYASAGF